MNITLPDAKPYYIDFSNDYYYRITRAGSLYEKLAALGALTNTTSRFFRVDSFADQDKFSINYYRLFKDQMLNLLSGVIRDDATMYGGTVVGGQYQPTPVVDPNIYGKAKYTQPDYMLPTTKRVATPVNKTIRYYALGLSLLHLDTTWDSTLDFSNYANVSIKGALDDRDYAAGTVVHEYTDPQSRAVYRAAELDPVRKGIGVQLIDELNGLTGQATVAGTINLKYGTVGGKALPDWSSAKAEVDAAQAAGDQARYTQALSVFSYIDYLVNYQIDLLNDVRTFKMAFAP